MHKLEEEAGLQRAGAFWLKKEPGERRGSGPLCAPRPPPAQEPRQQHERSQLPTPSPGPLQSLRARVPAPTPAVPTGNCRQGACPESGEQPTTGREAGLQEGGRAGVQRRCREKGPTSSF